LKNACQCFKIQVQKVEDVAEKNNFKNKENLEYSGTGKDSSFKVEVGHR
jgi:hypothetical protein